MMHKILTFSVIGVLGVLTVSTGTDNEPALSGEDRIALELGRKVQAVAKALQEPTAKNSLPVVRDLGTDSRYYVMVRGWIRQHIEMTESYRGTSAYRNSEERRDEIDAKITALQKMLRAIDLE